MTRKSRQSHFYKISKRLIDKHTLFAHNEMSFFASVVHDWRIFSVMSVSSSGVMLVFQNRGLHLTLR